LSQEALDVSNTKVILDLAHVAHVNYQEVGIGGSALLNQLRINGDGIMDEVHSWRNTFEADIVSLFALLSDVGGVGYLPSSPAGDDRLGFNVNRVQQMANTYTLIHEIGHNMGNMHSRNQAASAAGPTGGVFPYSTGWRWIGGDNQSYASVMTYESSPLDGIVSRRTPHFSNPQISFTGVPTGTTSFSDPFGPADNARSMREMKDVIAAYRPRDFDSGLPRVTSVMPAWGARGSAVSIVFRGNNINSIARFTNNCGFQNVSGTINNSTQITVSASIPFNAVQGKCDVTFWTGNVNASTSAAAQFTITDFPITMPTVSTTTVSNVGPSSAKISGTVTFDGGDPVSARGVCLSTAPNPTTDDICVPTGLGDGSFIAEYEALTPSTTYNARAYATNLAGTAYGQQLSFTTSVPVLNKAPTIDSISDVTVTVTEAFELVVPITGISFGDDEFDQQVTITASSSNPDLIELEVEYESPLPTGSLIIRGDGNRTGDATVTVTVRDAGGTAFGGIDTTVIKFAVQVLMGTNLNSDSDKPADFNLYQNFPNPFNPTTQISFTLPVGSPVDVSIYDVMGRRVTQLLDAYTQAGTHTITLDAKALPSGVYMYVIRAGEWSASKKMTLIK